MEIRDFAEYLVVWTRDYLATTTGIDLISFSPSNSALSPDSIWQDGSNPNLQLIRYQLIVYAEREPKAVHLNFYYSPGRALELHPPFKVVNWQNTTEAGCDWLIFSILIGRQSDAIDLIKHYVDKCRFTIQGQNWQEPDSRIKIRPHQWH